MGKIKTQDDVVECKGCKWRGKVRDCDIEYGDGEISNGYFCPMCGVELASLSRLGWATGIDCRVLFE